MFKKLFRNFIKSPVREEIYPGQSRNRINSLSAITFVIHQGSGGTVIETEFYDQHNDRMDRNLYVIPDDQDLGAEISRILLMESLRK